MMTKRAEYTKEKIQQAMLALLAEKPYETITMADVAQRAGRNRATVYRHYGDKESLLLAYFETAVETIKEDLVYPQSDIGQSTSQITYANLLVFYNHVAENQLLYRALFTSAAGSMIRTRFRRFIAGAIIHIMAKDGNLALLPKPPNVVANLVADMVVGGIIWWLESEANVEPRVLAEMVVRLGETGMFGLTGQEVTEGDISFRPFSSN